MSYKFILGSNPQHDPGKRKQYIVCIEPHMAILQVHNDDKGKLDSLEIKFLHVNISQFQPDTVQITQMPTEAEIQQIKGRMLRNAWHWYKSVLEDKERRRKYKEAHQARILKYNDRINPI